jgi:hypothetical protein
MTRCYGYILYLRDHSYPVLSCPVQKEEVGREVGRSRKYPLQPITGTPRFRSQRSSLGRKRPERSTALSKVTIGLAPHLHLSPWTFAAFGESFDHDCPFCPSDGWDAEP